jgi:hypothetical protein
VTFLFVFVLALNVPQTPSPSPFQLLLITYDYYELKKQIIKASTSYPFLELLIFKKKPALLNAEKGGFFLTERYLI